MFSQSLLSLDLIEDFLARVNTEDGDDGGGGAMADYLDTWIPGNNNNNNNNNTLCYLTMF